MVDIQATFAEGAGEREELSVSLAWHARRQLSFIIARELSLIWQSLSRPSSLTLGTIAMPTRSIYTYDVIALIYRNNEVPSPPKQHHANMMTSAVRTHCSGQWPTRNHKKQAENLFRNVTPYRMTQQPQKFQRIWYLRNVRSYTFYNTVPYLGRPNNTVCP